MTEKFMIDTVTSQVDLQETPIPESVETWLNGERMTGMSLNDVNGRSVYLGPLRPDDTIIICYQPETSK